MPTAFEKAIEASYYAGRLWEILTHPDVIEGRQPKNPDDTLVLDYPPTPKNTMNVSGIIPARIQHIFQEVANMSGPLREDAATSLQRTVSTLRRIVAYPDPAPGYTTPFSNVQQPLIAAMPEIEVAALRLNII